MIDSRVTDEEALKLLTSAIHELLIRFPLAGLSCLGGAVVIVEALNIKTLETDGREIRYSPVWIRNITKRARILDILHEWLHVFFNHVIRCSDRDPRVWNIACDIIVVREACDILTKESGEVWSPPEDGVIPPEWAKGMTAEQIYDTLMKDRSLIKTVKKPKRKDAGSPTTGPFTATVPDTSGDDDEILNSKDFDYASAKEKADKPEDEDQFYRSFSEELAQAALILSHTKQKTVTDLFGPVIGSRLDVVLRGKLPWGRLLKGDLVQKFGSDFASFAPPSRKHWPDVILPSLKARMEKILILAIDDSASVGERVHREFVANVMPAAMRAEKTIVITFDQVVREEIHIKNPKSILTQVKFLTGGHSYTSVKGVFEIVDRIKPTAIAVETDGYVELPDKSYPNTLWCIPRNGKPQPWGRNYIMDISW